MAAKKGREKKRIRTLIYVRMSLFIQVFLDFPPLFPDSFPVRDPIWTKRFVTVSKSRGCQTFGLQKDSVANCLSRNNFMASTLYLYVVHVHVGIYGNPNNKKYKRRAESIVDMFSFNCIHLWFIIIIIICLVFFLPSLFIYSTVFEIGVLVNIPTWIHVGRFCIMLCFFFRI